MFAVRTLGDRWNNPVAIERNSPTSREVCFTAPPDVGVGTP